MMTTNKMSLKVFWETVEVRLTSYTADELRSILHAMARDVPPSQRQVFLETLTLDKDVTLGAQQAAQQDELLSDIDDFIQEFKTAQAGADAWEERYEWDDHYDDEDSLGPYEEFVAPLEALFDRTQATFDADQLDLTHTAYKKLFEVMNLEDDYGRGISPNDLTGVDMDEAQARYLRATYETGPLEDRPRVLFEEMGQIRSTRMQRRMMIDDLIQISPKPLADQDTFLVDWIAFLRTQPDRDADGWLREAIRLSQGIAGLEQLSKTEGLTRPRAYLDWFTELEKASQYQTVLVEAQAALKALPDDLPIRAAIADHLCAAASHLQETEMLQAGRWEAFEAKPTLTRLLDLWDAAVSTEHPESGFKKQQAVMKQAAQHTQEYLYRKGPHQAGFHFSEDSLEQPAWIDHSILAHAFLLSQNFEAAQQLAAKENVLGWSNSDNTQGLVIPFFLIFLSGKSPENLPRNLGELWNTGLQASISFRFSGDDLLKRLSQTYETYFNALTDPIDQQQRYITWCQSVAEKRADAIVSAQYRKSYGKAALVVAAVAETLKLRGDEVVANAIITIVGNRFPRHSAFQKELKNARARMK